MMVLIKKDLRGGDVVVVIRAPYAVSAIVSVATVSNVVNVTKVSTKKMK
jgi:hypothetical protein